MSNKFFLKITSKKNSDLYGEGRMYLIRLKGAHNVVFMLIVNQDQLPH
jgi:hypothetical protein